jgi:hypothetical protein
MSATWYKLKDETWGVKIRHDGKEGEQVEVTSKNRSDVRQWTLPLVRTFRLDSTVGCQTEVTEHATTAEQWNAH